MMLKVTNVNEKDSNVFETLPNNQQQNSWITRKSFGPKNPDFMPEVSEINETSRSNIFDNCQLKIAEPENINTLPSTYLQNTKLTNANFSLDDNQITSTFKTQLSDTNHKCLLKLFITHNHPTSVPFVLIKKIEKI